MSECPEYRVITDRFARRYVEFSKMYHQSKKATKTSHLFYEFETEITDLANNPEWSVKLFLSGKPSIYLFRSSTQHIFFF